MSPNPTFNLKLKPATKAEKAEVGIQKTWIIVGVIALLATVLVVGPKFTRWTKITKHNNSLEETIAKAKIDNEDLTEEKKDLELDKKQKGKEDEQKEAMIFPTEIDTFRIANVLEVLALQLENVDVDRDSKFTLEGIRYSGTEDLGAIMSLKSNINVQGDIDSLKQFVDFIKSGTIPQKVIDGETTEVVSTNVLTELQDELLPVATIERIQITKGRKDDIYKANLFVHFYSRKS